MNTIKVSYDEIMNVANWNVSKEFYARATEIQKHMECYGFLFNEFRLIIDNNKLQFKVEIDKDIFRVVRIVFHKGIKEEYVFSYNEYIENMLKIDIDKNYVTSDISKCSLLLGFVNYVIYKAMNQEPILIEQTERRYTGSGRRSTKKDVYSLTDCVRKYAKHVNHCKHVITCEHWEVRGHFRHLKSGKVIFVKPFEKGKNRNVQTKNKVYTI